MKTPDARPRVAAACTAERLERRVLFAAPTDIRGMEYATGLGRATSMEFLPDGRLFVTEQAGKVRVIARDADGLGTLLAAPFVTIPVIGGGLGAENGLLCVTPDPRFMENGYVYVYYTTGVSPNRFNRVSRFTAADADPDPAAFRPADTAVPGSEMVLTDLDPDSAATFHNGGGMHFGADGKLYVAVGENTRAADAQSLDNRRGKILRLNPDGSIPEDNPFYNVATGLNRQIWALGLRNPFTFAVQQGTGRMFINDVGSAGAADREEINEAIAGANYGWPLIEGVRTTQPLPTTGAYRDPFFAYPARLSGGSAIAGGAFYEPQVAALGSQYVGKYFYGDYAEGFIRYIDPASAAPAASDFLPHFPPSVVDLDVGPDGFLYHLAPGGQVYRLASLAALAPRIRAQPQPDTVTEGETATFDVSAVGYDRFSLGYQWQRDGVDIQGATAATYTTPPAATGDDGARFRVRVTTRWGTETLSDEAALTVRPKLPSVVGRHVFYNNSAFDGRDPAANAADDGAIAPDKQALRWLETATFANVTGYSRGLNGIMADVADVPDSVTLSAADFEFRTGRGDGAWAEAPSPASFTVRPGFGDEDSDRVTITWPDGRIVNRWLQVTFKPSWLDLAPGIFDQFYFGNLRGEIGDAAAPTRLAVNAIDVVGTRRAFGSSAALLTSPYDHNRDGRVNVLDVRLAVQGRGHSLPMFTAPPPPPSATVTAWLRNPEDVPR